MERPKWVAIVTGVLALLLSFGYLLLVQLLDFRGEFKPAPIEPLGQVMPLETIAIAPPQLCVTRVGCEAIAFQQGKESLSSFKQPNC